MLGRVVVVVVVVDVRGVVVVVVEVRTVAVVVVEVRTVAVVVVEVRSVVVAALVVVKVVIATIVEVPVVEGATVVNSASVVLIDGLTSAVGNGAVLLVQQGTVDPWHTGGF